MAEVVVQCSDAGAASVGDGMPVGGSFTEADPTGLIWAMTPSSRDASAFITPLMEGMTVAFTAATQEADMQAVPDTAEAFVTRRYVDPDVQVSRIHDNGVTGTLFEPTGSDRKGGVLLVPGALPSDQYVEQMGGLLAARGLVAFVVEYQEQPGEIVEVPLETFVTATEWLMRHPRIDRRRTGAIGVSRGGEALLALLSHADSQLRAAVVISPSCVSWQATSRRGKAPNTSAWTWKGNPLPFMKFKAGGVRGQKLMKSVTKRRSGGGVSLLAAHTESLKDKEAFARAMFPIERYHGPILFLAGDDDQFWPSGEMIDLLYGRRRARGSNLEDQKLRFEGAGHLLRFPYLPTTTERYLDAGGENLDFGGNPLDGTRGDQATWEKVLDFFEIHLGSIR
jgi:acetyl esterase/lipase